jgi:hypothetical protein
VLVVERDYSATVMGERSSSIGNDDTLTVGNNRELAVRGESTHKAMSEVLFEAEEKLVFEVGASRIELTPAGIKVTSINVTMEAVGENAFKGAQVQINPGVPTITAEMSKWPDQTPLLEKHRGLISERLSAGAQLFINGVSASDVRQGSIGDCYLMASMAAIAHAQPQLIEQMFEQTADGDYKVKLHDEEGMLWWKESVDKEVTIDDTVPHVGGGSIYGDSTDEGESWVGLTEKAYAETFGGGEGYEGIGHGDHPGTALERLTGWESDETVMLFNKDSTWETLQDAQANGYPTTASSEPWDFLVPEDSGVVSGHAYTVTGVSEVNGERMVNVRNPWGGAGTSTTKSGRVVETGDFTMPYDKFYSSFKSVTTLKPPK